jgi:hypothetical protein
VIIDRIRHHSERRVSARVHSEFVACTQLPIDRFIKYSSLALLPTLHHIYLYNWFSSFDTTNSHIIGIDIIVPHSFAIERLNLIDHPRLGQPIHVSGGYNNIQFRVAESKRSRILFVSIITSPIYLWLSKYWNAYD